MKELKNKILAHEKLENKLVSNQLQLFNLDYPSNDGINELGFRRKPYRANQQQQKQPYP
jgi:hypothetical protein